jgi:SAM-dependent methyltransferase
MEFVGECVKDYGLGRVGFSVLEIGSLDLNGSVRLLFAGDYTGIDRKEGDGVDLVMDGHALDFLDHQFDVVVSTSALEHDPEFWRTLAEVRRVLRPGGYFILTTVSWGFFEHDKPDYYRFMPDVYPLLMELAGCDVVEWREDPQSGGPQMLGRRHGA